MRVSLSRQAGRFVIANVMIGGAMLLTSVSVLQAAKSGLPKAEAILDAHLEVTGGKQAHLKLKTRKMTGTLTVDMAGHKFKAKLVVHAQAPGKSHLVIDSSLMNMVRVCDGKEAWEWNAGHSRDSNEKADDSQRPESTRLLKGSDKTRAIKMAQFHAKVEWRKHFKSVKTIGVVNVEGRPAYEVRVTPKSGDDFSQFYDQENGRLVKYKKTVKSSHFGKIDMEVFIGKYRKFDGVWLATEVKQLLDVPNGEKGTQTWTYTKIQHNVKIPASLFKMPDELKKRKAS